jgi:predicted GIY-YIG superfamily endonuclease
MGKRKPKGYWTKDRCQEEALKYQYRGDFSKNSNTTYTLSRTNDWLDEICTHMTEKKKPNGYWTKERCQEEALKYKYIIEFKEKSGSAYNKIISNGWLDEICSHLVYINKERSYWNIERCQEEALKYKYRNDFSINSSNIYNISRENNWLDEICVHMIERGNKYKRLIYAYEFNDNHVYIGLTYDLDKRNTQHLTNTNSQIYKHIKITNSKYKILELTKYIDVKLSKEKEQYYIDLYKKENWYILNRAKGGAIGGKELYWTKDKCQEEALKYRSRSEFKNNTSGSYYSALKYNWLDEICAHMERPINIKWTKNKCQEEALKYKSRSEFKTKTGGIYNSALRNKWLDNICSHMVQIRNIKGHWNKERCQEEALKYKSRSEFKTKSGPAYYMTLNNDWLDDMCSHMKEKRKPKGYWSKERCQEESLKYKSRSAFNTNSKSAYLTSLKNKWLDDICSHMKPKNFR